MEFGKAFSYPFADSDWVKKIGIGALLLLIPLLGSMWISGWMLEITKRVIRQDPEPLADWDDFGGYLVRGFQVFIIGLVYALPIILLQACLQTVIFALGDSSTAGDEVTYAITAISVCVGCVVFLYAILLALMVPAALGNFADKEKFGAAFRFGEVWGLVRAAPGAYILAALGTMLAGFVGLLGLILCAIGVVLTTAYANSVIGHFYGQAYNAATASKQLESVSEV
jgi:hypothetical protein